MNSISLQPQATLQAQARAVEAAIAIIDGNRLPRPSERESIIASLQEVRQTLWDAALSKEQRLQRFLDGDGGQRAKESE